MHNTLNHTARHLKLALGLGTALWLSPAHAGPYMSEAELRALLSDKTVHARHERNSFNFIQYFAPDGGLTQLTDKGEKKVGKWYLLSDGTLCVNWDHVTNKTCGPVIDQGNGSYKRMQNPRNIMSGVSHIVTFERVENGNPEGL